MIAKHPFGTRALVGLFERFVPDPYVFAVGLTLLTAVLALIFAPHRTANDLLGGWYKGIFDILEFAFQMILVLVTGYALANSAPVERALAALAGVPKSGKAAVALTFVVSAIACWLNWGFGLVVAALLARAISRRLPIDFGWLVAAAYSGFLIWASGLSSSIALAQATHGSKLNIVEQLTGHVLPLNATVFTAFNLVPCLVLLIVLPIVFTALEPAQAVVANVEAADERIVPTTAEKAQRIDATSVASRLNNAWPLNVIIALAGFAYLFLTWSASGIAPDINSVILMFLCAGLLLHWTPKAYVGAVNDAARITGPLILQYPLYGGIMGIMKATGLAGVIAVAFGAFATGHTLPFWSYASSIVISLFVPSGGGHWAVQGPFAVPAALHLHASLPATAMGVAMGEQVANMIQPFWALPILAIAGVPLQRVMAFTAISFVIAFIVFAASLLLLV